MDLWHLFLGVLNLNNTQMQKEGTISFGGWRISTSKDDCNFKACI